MQYWHDLNFRKLTEKHFTLKSPELIAASKLRSCFSVRPGAGICFTTSSIMVLKGFQNERLAHRIRDQGLKYALAMQL